MSLSSGSTKRHCYAVGCSNGDYRRIKWKDSWCPTHRKRQDTCLCPPPFQLHPFPTEKKNSEKRQRWLKALCRGDPQTPHLLLQPKQGHRVCSDHFVDGKPTEKHPDPEVKLGHTAKENPTGHIEHDTRQAKRAKIQQNTSQSSQDELV